MAGGGGDLPPLDGGEFLLQLLKNPPHRPQPQALPQQHPPQPSQTLPHDPAVAAVGPTLPFPPVASNGHDLPYRPPFAPHNYFIPGFPQNPSLNPNSNPNPNWSSSPPGFNYIHSLPMNQNLFDDLRKLEFSSRNQQEHNLIFGSLPSEIRNSEGVPNDNSDQKLGSGAKVEGSGNRRLNNGLEVDFSQTYPDLKWKPQVNSRIFGSHVQERAGSSGTGLKTQQLGGGNYRSMEASPQVRPPPPGFSSKPRTLVKRNFEQNADKGKGKSVQSNYRTVASIDGNERGRVSFDDVLAERGLSGQLENPGPPRGSNLHSVPASDIKESLMELHRVDGEDGKKSRKHVLHKEELDDLGEQLVTSLLLEEESDEKNDRRPHPKSRDKDYRSDKRGQWLLNQRMRNYKRQTECRSDINRLNAPFLAIYESLIQPEEEKAKQKQLVMVLDRHVTKEWPEARLFLYGSCANSFGFTKSDIDVCLAIEDEDVNKSELLLKLADILQTENLENVQALTRARVPIVKLMDPVTGISCDICVNNMLAVINTKLLRDYAKIDVRLRQLAFIVKHWAKSRGVNETYQGTLSSYAYVLMCINFLQQRRPSILPCLQSMERTYAITVEGVECAYFDQVEKLYGFGLRNEESIAQLVWAFFNYWAYCHDYANNVISVRTGSILSKRAKDWTKRIGNDRHLICIEDPFELSHDLGRVVDRRSIRVLREEFERAAEIMQYDPNPCVTLFQPYVAS